MKAKPRALARSAAQVLAAATFGAGGVFFVAAPAYAAVPTITAVAVPGTTSKVVTAGTTVLITGTGFSGMTDNAAAAPCSVTPVAWPGAGSGCSQVRFVGNTGTYTLATRYSVISDTQIYAVVPSGIPDVDTASTAGAPVPGTGSIKIQVVNTMANGTGSLGSVVGTTSELFYRGPLTAAVSSVKANPNGGGTITATVSGITLASATFVAEKITGYFYNTYGSITAQKVNASAIAYASSSTVTVTVPAGSVSDEPIGLMLLHDGVVGTPDTSAVTYPAVITKIETCSSDVSAMTTTTSPLPTCTGSASVPATGNADVKITGKGFTGSSGWTADGTGGTVAETCVVMSDTLAYCDLDTTVTPTGNVAVLTFTADDADSAGNPVVEPTGGSVLVFTSMV